MSLLTEVALALGRLMDGDGGAISTRDQVSVEHPGCVVIYEPYPDGRLQWWFGTANGTWAGDLTEFTDDDVQVLETRETGVAGDCTDAETIARGILHALTSGVSR